MSKNIVAGFFGLALGAFGALLLCLSLAFMLGSTILVNVCGLSMFSFLQVGGLLGCAMGLIMIFVGIMLFNDNQTKVLRVLVGLYGLGLVIGGAILAVATVETIVGPVIFAVIALIGVAVIDIGWGTKLVAPVSNILKRI